VVPHFPFKWLYFFFFSILVHFLNEKGVKGWGI